MIIVYESDDPVQDFANQMKATLGHEISPEDLQQVYDGPPEDIEKAFDSNGKLDVDKLKDIMTKPDGTLDSKKLKAMKSKLPEEAEETKARALVTTK